MGVDWSRCPCVKVPGPGTGSDTSSGGGLSFLRETRPVSYRSYVAHDDLVPEVMGRGCVLSPVAGTRSEASSGGSLKIAILRRLSSLHRARSQSATLYSTRRPKHRPELDLNQNYLPQSDLQPRDTLITVNSGTRLCEVSDYPKSQTAVVRRLTGLGSGQKTGEPETEDSRWSEVSRCGLHDYIRRATRLHSDKTALICGHSGKAFTFRTVHNLSRRLASALARDGVTSGDVIGLTSDNVPEAAILLLAVLQLGAALAIFDTTLVESLDEHLLSCGVHWVVISPGCADAVLKASVHLPCIKKVYILGESDLFYPFHRLLEDDGRCYPHHVTISPNKDVALLTLSDDVTDNKQVAHLTHRNMVTALTQMSSTLSELTFVLSCLLFVGYLIILTLVSSLRWNSSDDVIMAVAPFSHSFGLMVALLLPLVQGCCVVTMPHWEPRRAVPVCKQHKVTVIPVLPVWASALTSRSTSKQFGSTKPKLVVLDNGFDPALTLPSSILRPKKHTPLTRVVSVGEASSVIGVYADYEEEYLGPVELHLLPDLQCQIVDVCDLHLLEAGDVGEICVRGPQVAPPGVNPVLGALRDDWLHTGCAGYVDDAGCLYVTGRIEGVTNNDQIHASVAETILKRHPAVGDAAVLSTFSMYAVVVRKPEFPDVTTEQIVRFANSTLPSGRRVSRVEFVPSIPRSVSGRILRSHLNSLLAMRKYCGRHN